jgi:hypothetical protein
VRSIYLSNNLKANPAGAFILGSRFYFVCAPCLQQRFEPYGKYIFIKKAALASVKLSFPARVY